MKKTNEKNGEQKPRKSINPLKVTAIVLTTLAFLLVMAALGIGVLLWYSEGLRGSMFSSDDPISQVQQDGPVDADWIDEYGNAYNYRDDVISILLMGVDTMSEETDLWKENTISNGGNADMLGLVIMDTTTFDFSVLYIPRDTITDVIAMDADGNYIDTVQSQICTSHSYGDGEELSCQLTADAVSNLLMGAPVDRYAALDEAALQTLNEIVGGVRITFESDCTDIHHTFFAGNTVTLNNWYFNRMVVYRNHENPDGAYLRGMRIMNVMKALFHQLKETITKDPTVALEIVNKLSAYLTTDLELTEITYLARNIGQMDFSADTIVKLRGDTVMGETYAEFHPDPDWIHDFVVEKFCVPAQ